MCVVNSFSFELLSHCYFKAICLKMTMSLSIWTKVDYVSFHKLIIKYLQFFSVSSFYLFILLVFKMILPIDINTFLFLLFEKEN